MSNYHCFTFEVPVFNFIIDVHVTWDCSDDEYREVMNHFIYPFGNPVYGYNFRSSACMDVYNDECKKIILILDDKDCIVIAHEILHAVICLDHHEPVYDLITYDGQETACSIHSYMMKKIWDEVEQYW